MTRRIVFDKAHLTPFAQIVYGYLMRDQPTKLVADLAYETGINNQTIWDWLRKGVIPRRATIIELSRKTGLPLDDLLRAAGLPTEAELALDRAGNARAARLLARRYEAALDQLTTNNPTFTDAQRALLRRWAREELPAVLLQGDDLLREVGAADVAPDDTDAGGVDDTKRHPKTPATHEMR